MRRLAAVVLALGAAVVPAAAARPNAEGVCLSKVVEVFFWPRGHAAILSGLRTPEPHAEVFGTPLKGYPPFFLAFAAVDGRIEFSGHCTRRRETSALRRVLPARTIRVRSKVTCDVPGGGVVQARRVEEGAVRLTLRVFERPNKVLVLARFARRGSSLSYTVRRCKRSNAPS